MLLFEEEPEEGMAYIVRADACVAGAPLKNYMTRALALEQYIRGNGKQPTGYDFTKSYEQSA